MSTPSNPTALSAAPQSAPRAMSSVLSLIGLMLVAKLVVDVTDAIITEWVVDNERLLATLLLSLPTLVLLGIVGVLMRRDALDPQTIKRLLVITMIVIALQIVLRPAVISMLASAPLAEQGNLARLIRGGGFARSRTRLQTGVLFMMIPAVVGAWMSGRRGAFRWALLGIVISGIAIVIVNENDLTVLDLLPFIAEDVALVLLTLFVGTLADQERDEQLRLQEANRLLAEQGRVREQLAASRERIRMARDLHDTVAHSLAGLVFQLDALGTLMGDASENTREILTRAKGTARQGLEDARTAITDLRAGLVEDSGLVGALQQHIEVADSLGRVPITFEHANGGNVNMDVLGLSQTQADALFRIAQEAIYNASRHAQAKCIHVRLVQERLPELSQTYLTLSVQDDGIGFDESTVQDGHYGLRGMRERAELVGAHLRVDSNIGKGTTLLVTLPLKI